MSSFNLFGASVSLLAKIELLPVLKKLLEITHCKSSTIIQIRGAKKKKKKPQNHHLAPIRSQHDLVQRKSVCFRRRTGHLGGRGKGLGVRGVQGSHPL